MDQVLPPSRVWLRETISLSGSLLHVNIHPFSLRVITLLVLVLDIVLVIVKLSVGEDHFPVKVEEAFEVLALLFSAYFCAEVALRIVGQG